MPFIGKNPTAGFATIVKDDFTADGTTTVFTLSKIATVNDIAVYVGNVRQEPTDAYTVNGTTLTMSAAPATGVNFYVLHIAGTIESSVVPPDGSIGTAKLIYPLTTFSSTGIDDNASSTAMTLTSSNDVVVGNTAANVVSNTSTQGGGGYVASDKHFEFATDSNRAAVEIGKNNANDGQLVAFRKQGTTVGHIGVGNSSAYVYIGTGDTGLMFNSGNDFIQPWNPSTNGSKDNGIDLGNAGNRFKNLYLSGGAYLGGVGAANHLDDYEEGTWTPVLVASGGNPSLSYGAQSGTYTRIGRYVYTTFFIQINGVSSQGAGSLRIGPLPFTLSTAYGYSVENGAIFYDASALGQTGLNTLTGRGIGTDQILLTNCSSTGAAQTINTGGLNPNYVIGSYLYITDA